MNRGGAAWSLLLVAAGIAAWSAWDTAVQGLTQPGAALAFGALVALGELVRLSYPAGRLQTPLGLAGGLAYALLSARPGGAYNHTVAQILAVVAAGMLLGSAPHALAGRSVALLGMARRLLVICLVAVLHAGALDAAGAVSEQLGLQIEAVLMIAVLIAGYAADCCIRALVAWAGTRRSLWRHLRIEVKVAPGIDASIVATAVTLAIATSIMGLSAIPLFSIPLLVTQLSYRRFNAARATYAQTIEALSKATELAGFTVVGHARRVADLSLRLGKALGLGPHELANLEHAALLHDLGQMALPEPLPGGATVEAPRSVRMRIASAGAEIIEEAQIPGSVAVVVGRQAEGFDAHQRRSELPLASRIIAVANAYDDLTGATPSPERDSQTLRRIQAGAGRDFDPEIVEVLALALSGTGEAQRARGFGRRLQRV